MRQLPPQTFHGTASDLKLRRAGRTGWLLALTLLLLGLIRIGAAAAPHLDPHEARTNKISLAELRHLVTQNGRTVQSFYTEGVVCAVAPQRTLLTLQDHSGPVILEVPEVAADIQAGTRIALFGEHCALTRARFSVQLGTAPVVDNGGRHGATTKSGSVFLAAGLHPIRLAWFNGLSDARLAVAYEGPALPRQTIPDTALFRSRPAAATPANLESGLNYSAYVGDWFFQPAFEKLPPVRQGVARNFDVKLAVQPEKAGLNFTGFLNITNAGVHTFYLESDDGAWLYVGEASQTVRITPLEKVPPPQPRSFPGGPGEMMANEWTELEGVVAFVGQNDQDTELELEVNAGSRVQVTIIRGLPHFDRSLLRQRVKIAGLMQVLPNPELRQSGRLIVIAPDHVQVIAAETAANQTEWSHDSLLTSIGQIRHLPRDVAARNPRARIRGVITWSSPLACVMQDATGGVYIHYTPKEHETIPLVGTYWEMEGYTDPGGFSPVLMAQRGTFIGPASLPAPIRPTADQLLNGSLDAEYVELRGVLAEIADDHLTLLTAEGKVRIRPTDDWPLPPSLAPSTARSNLLDSIVRIRGCVSARVSTARTPADAELRISPATVSIEELAPADPFALPVRKREDWLAFDPGGGILQRTKIAGQIVLGREGEYCVQAGTAGLRVRVKSPEKLAVGDLVEAVGFPRLGGPSPLLQEARVKVVGQQPLPAPVSLSPEELANNSHDATLVQVEAVLREDWSARDARALELQSGPNHFLAPLLNQTNTPLRLQAGSRVRVTGVYAANRNENSGRNASDFQLWLLGPQHIELLQAPPWWTLKRALTSAAVLAAILCAASAWIIALRRKVEHRTTQLKQQIEEGQMLEQQRVMEQERTRVAQDLHDELGAGLTEVGLLGDLVKNPAVPTTEKQQYLGQLTDTARSLVASLDEIVWAVNPQYDSVGSLASYFTLFAQRFLDLAGVACRPQIPDHFPELFLDSKSRHGLFLAFRESLNNVVRHSGATEVRLKLEVLGGELIVCVTDNGRGFESGPDVLGADGLPGMQRRMKELGGSCRVRSQRGQGTEVELRLPISKTRP